MPTERVEPTERAKHDEAAIRASFAAGDLRAVTTAALRKYGPELFGFLVGLHKDYDTASDAFAMFSERLWVTMPQFDWRCSLRTWCYRLARNAAIDLLRGERCRGKNHVHLCSAPEVLEVATRVRTETLSFLRTEKRTALERLRDELAEEDRVLLILRADRELEWAEVALVLAEPSATVEDAELKREAVRLRKRFQLVKERLRALGRARGLL
jgi:RNA polymerase sigma-70 factor (ECF subfamily)